MNAETQGFPLKHCILYDHCQSSPISGFNIVVSLVHMLSLKSENLLSVCVCVCVQCVLLMLPITGLLQCEFANPCQHPLGFNSTAGPLTDFLSLSCKHKRFGVICFLLCDFTLKIKPPGSSCLRNVDVEDKQGI